MFAVSRRAALWLPLLAASAAWAAEDFDNTIILTTKHGKVTIKLRPDWAPKHVAQIKTLVKQKFYDGLTFHRVIPEFMAQTGDPTGTGSGAPPFPTCRPSSTRPISHEESSAWRARRIPIRPIRSFLSQPPTSDFLDGKYTAFGEVTSGMDVVDKIKAGTKDNNGAVTNPDKIVTMRMASGAK